MVTSPLRFCHIESIYVFAVKQRIKCLFAERLNMAEDSFIHVHQSRLCIVEICWHTRHSSIRRFVVGCHDGKQFHELLRRQVKRMRPDIVTVTVAEMVKMLGEEEAFNQLEEEEQWPWFEEQRLLGKLDGFIVPRAVHAGYRMKSRRHTLGLQRDQSESNRERFLPPPLHGFTLLVARDGFPKASIKEMIDPSAELAYRLESAMLESLDPSLHPIIGLYVEQRKISTFLKKANQEGDETLLTSLVDPNKKKGVYKSGPRVEMLI